jgi:hypothetical protein
MIDLKTDKENARARNGQFTRPCMEVTAGYQKEKPHKVLISLELIDACIRQFLDFAI